MNENYLNSSYERHKNDSTETLQKIINNPNKFSQEVVHVAKIILQERTNGDVSKTEQATFNNSKLSENPVVILDSINRNINTIKNIIIIIFLLSILNAILQFMD